MKKLWAIFAIVAHHVLKAGGRLAIGWPYCVYWHDARVRDFSQRSYTRQIILPWLRSWGR